MANSQSQTVKASILHGARDIRVSFRTLPPPVEGEVQVQVLATGLCGSDLHYFAHFRNGNILVCEPLTLGHESAGRVVATGSGVSDLQVGDLVALEVGLPCGECDLCEGGRYNICPGMRFRSSAKAVPHPQGTLQERVNHPAKWCHKLPENTPPELGALAEPLSVAIHAHARSSTPFQDATVLVFGAGTVGLLCAAVSKVHGARAVIVADINEDRLAFALKHGFAHAVVRVPDRRPETTEEKLEFAREVAAVCGAADVGGKEVGEVNVCFEGTGVEVCLQSAIYATRPGGKVMLIGMGNPVQTLPISHAALREVDLVGVFRYAHAYPKAISLLGQSPPPPGLPNLAALVTHKFRGIEKTPEAFNMAARVRDEEGGLVMKVVVEGDDVCVE